MSEIQLYQSVLLKLGQVSAENLAVVDAFLTELVASKQVKKGQNQKLAQSLAGAWKNWDDASFELFLQQASNTRASLFADRSFEA